MQDENFRAKKNSRLDSDHFFFTWKENKEDSDSLIINVPKKILRSSVDRNRVKRRIRHTFIDCRFNFLGRISVKKNVVQVPYPILRKEIEAFIKTFNKVK